MRRRGIQWVVVWKLYEMNETAGLYIWLMTRHYYMFGLPIPVEIYMFESVEIGSGTHRIFN